MSEQVTFDRRRGATISGKGQTGAPAFYEEIAFSRECLHGRSVRGRADRPAAVVVEISRDRRNQRRLRCRVVKVVQDVRLAKIGRDKQARAEVSGKSHRRPRL